MEAAIAKQKLNIKLLFGLEGYLFDDKVPMLSIDDTPLSEPEYVVFDLETTGLDSQSDRIIEIAAVKVKDGEVVGRFSTFVDPERNISDKIVRLTGITNSMVAGAPDQKTAVSSFLDFARGSILVAHNAAFDTSLYAMPAINSGLNTALLHLIRWRFQGCFTRSLRRISLIRCASTCMCYWTGITAQ